jgi:hypothetical protein
LWSSGALIQRHFCSPQVFSEYQLQNRRVLELGSGLLKRGAFCCFVVLNTVILKGSGLLALKLQALGAKVVATDIEPDLSMLRRQISRRPNCGVDVEEFAWGEKGWEESSL